jgi:hypothetical protein
MPSLDGAAVGGIALASILGILFGIGGLIGAGYWTWFNAPPVGGEWWFYIRIVVTVVAAMIGAKASALAGYIVGGIIGSIAGGIFG